MNKNIMPLAISAGKAAEMLGVSKPKVYELMRRGDFPSFKLGTRTLISVEGLREWVLQQAKNKEDLGACV